MLGAAQLQWLKNELLTSSAKFKFLVSAVMVNDFGTTSSDSWAGFTSERSDLFEFIKQNGIKNVIFLSGDQHWAGAFLIDYPVNQIGYGKRGFYEISPTPLTADPRDRNQIGKSANPVQTEWGYLLRSRQSGHHCIARARYGRDPSR